MRGRPLDEAKKCACMIVNSLKSNDRISIIAYDSRAEVIVPSTKVYNAEQIINSIRNIFCQGMTDLHAGWLLGAEEVARYKTENSVNRVLLLSDGMAKEDLPIH